MGRGVSECGDARWEAEPRPRDQGVDDYHHSATVSERILGPSLLVLRVEPLLGLVPCYIWAPARGYVIGGGGGGHRLSPALASWVWRAAEVGSVRCGFTVVRRKRERLREL
ncbi:hypothetical protein NL676_011940 [Syzygium grande]|nr:hypothetical protein NL676_011940 [Syzygium grande]